MPTTYVPAISLADTTKNKDGKYVHQHPLHYVKGFDTDPAKFLQDDVQPYLDAGFSTIMLCNPWGRDEGELTFSRRYDGDPASKTAVRWMPELYDEQDFALMSFIKSPGIERVFLYVGAPDITIVNTLRAAVERLERFRNVYPNCVPIYDNTGDIDATEHCAASALFAAHDAMARVPFNSPVPWGIEPNPANHSTVSPLVPFMPQYIYGTPLTWSAKSRFSLGTMAQVTIPIVAIRGDDYKTPESRLAAAREWGPKVAPFNGIVVVHGVSVAEMEGLSK